MTEMTQVIQRKDRRSNRSADTKANSSRPSSQELDRRAPGIPEVEIAFMYEANPEFKEYLQDKCR